MDTTMKPLALVTGASSGIGLALAQELAERGHDVVVVAEDARINDPSLLGGSGAPALAVQADLASAEGVEQVDRQVRDRGRPLAVLALNCRDARQAEQARLRRRILLTSEVNRCAASAARAAA